MCVHNIYIISNYLNSFIHISIAQRVKRDLKRLPNRIQVVFNNLLQSARASKYDIFLKFIRVTLLLLFYLSYSKASLISVSFTWLVVGNHKNVMDY